MGRGVVARDDRGRNLVGQHDVELLGQPGLQLLGRNLPVPCNETGGLLREKMKTKVIPRIDEQT